MSEAFTVTRTSTNIHCNSAAIKKSGENCEITDNTLVLISM